MMFSKPLAGAAMQELFYGAYFDHGGRDYDCRLKWYGGHRGVDILLRDFTVQDSGVAVLAAAPGTVFVVRDGVDDRSTKNGSGGAGNYVAIEHGNNGPVSRYFHLRKGSIRVAVGAPVARGDTLALVGSSGNSSWPHLHFEVAEGTVDIDPFRGSCNPRTTGATWQNQPEYQATFAVLDAGISNRGHTYAELLERPANVTTIRGSDPAVVFWTSLYNIRASATRTILLDASGTSVSEVVTGPVGTFSAIYLTATFSLLSLPGAGTFSIVLRVTEGDEREVVRRTFTFDPGVAAGVLRKSSPFEPTVWVSSPGGDLPHSLP
jgi:hypothetical protein